MAKTYHSNSVDLGIFTLRFITGFLMLFHGIHKVLNGHDFILKSLSKIGMPSFLWIGVPIAEVLAPLFLILGIFTRISSVSIIVLMLFTFWIIGPDAFTLTKTGAIKTEVNFYFLFSAIALLFTGSGRYALYKSRNRFLN